MSQTYTLKEQELYKILGLILEAHVSRSYSTHGLTGTFFCVITTAESRPRTPSEVTPPWLIALNAYSRRREFQKFLNTSVSTQINFSYSNIDFAVCIYQ